MELEPCQGWGEVLRGECGKGKRVGGFDAGESH